MKKQFLLIVSSAFLLLAGCNGTTTSSPVSSPDESSEETISSISEEERLASALSALGESIRLEGTSDWTREFPNPYYLLNNNEFTNEDVINITPTAFQATYDRVVSAGEDPVSDERLAYKNDEGLACTTYVAYDGSTQLTPIINDGESSLYSDDYANPFAFLTVDDLVPEDGGYSVSGDWALKFSHVVFGENYSGSLLLTLNEDGTSFASIQGSLSALEDFVSTGVYTKVQINVTFAYTISYEPTIDRNEFIGTEDQTLQAVLDKMADGFVFSILSDGEVSLSTYFDGDSALFQMMMPGATEANYFDMYLYPNAEGTMDLAWCNMDENTYELYWEENDPSYTEMYYEKVDYGFLTGDVVGLSSTVFTLGTDNLYHPVEGALQYIGSIIPGIYDALGLTSYDDFRYQCTSMTLNMVDAATLEMDFQSSYGSPTVTTVSASFRFSEIGTATLPYTPTLP